MPSVTIAILNYNGVPLLKTFLPSVVRFSQGHNVVVIDNGSTDESLRYLDENHANVSVISLDKNYGFCQGYNTGLENIESDYFILLNSDVEVTEGWIEPIINLMESDSTIAACQPKILSYREKNMFEYAGAAGGYIDWLGYPFCRGRIFNSLESDQGQYDEPVKVFWASGACFFVRANLFREAGGFNAKFFAHMEEIDLCWRFQNAGYSIWCQPQSKVYHLGGGTLEKGHSQKTYLNFRNNLTTLISNLPLSKRIIVLPIRLGFDFVASLKFLFAGGLGHFWAVFRAYLSLPGKGSRQLEKRSVPDLHGVLNRSLVIAYFVRKVRKFSELKFF